MSEIISLLLMFLPLGIVVAIANVAQKRREQGEAYEGVALIAYVLLVALFALALFIGLLVALFALLLARQPGLLSDAGIELEAIASLPLIGLGLWLPALLGVLLLLPPVRRTLARLLPIDAQNPVHAVALSLSMLVVTNLLLTLGIGLGNLADLVAQAGEGQQTTVAALWVQQILTALLAMVGVGWGIRRDGRATLARLGLTWPTGRQWLLGAGLGLAMVPVVLTVEALGALVGIGSSPDVERLTEQLLGPLFNSPFGILTLGLAAALGEETLFRGALLPRFGLIVTSLLFALVHSNYGITLSTLVVFILGLLLGFVRLRANTTTAMVLHAVYNIALGLLAVLAASTGLDF